jgi:O-antigen/teichoic acid export membrane protein
MRTTSDLGLTPGDDAEPRQSGPERGDAFSLSRAEVRRRSLSGVFYVTFSNLTNLIVGFGATLVLARLLTPGDFGVVAVGATAVLLAGALADGGLGAGMIRRPEPPTRAELKTMNGIQLAIALAFCVPIAAVALSFGRTGAVTALMILSLPITTLQTPGRITLSRAMQFDRQLVSDSGSQVISQVLTVVAVVMGAGVWGLAGGAVVKAVVGTVLINKLSTGFLMPSLRGWRQFGELLRFGLKFQATWYTFVGREQGLNVVLAAVGGVGTLGIWTFTNRIFQLPSLAFSSLYAVGFPTMANVIARGEHVGPIILRTVRRAAVIGTFIFATFAASSPELIPFAFGEAWRDAASIIPLVCISTLMLGSISVAATSYLAAAGRPGVVATASAALGVVWISVTAVLFSTLGVVAIGLGNLAGALVEATIINLATRKASGVSPYRPMVVPLCVAVVSGGVGWLVCVQGPAGFLTAAGAGLLTLALVALGLWLTCRNDLNDTLRLAFGSFRSSLPRLRKPSAGTA